ncbi:MAG: hypothetical protein EON54_13640, partial [Alcaligenaceae bacterium]
MESRPGQAILCASSTARRFGGKMTDANVSKIAELNPRTRRILEDSLMSNIIRLAIPNTIVIAVQVMIGLLEIFFVSRLSVEALAGVSQVFPLVSLIVG